MFGGGQNDEFIQEMKSGLDYEMFKKEKKNMKGSLKIQQIQNDLNGCIGKQNNNNSNINNNNKSQAI